VLCVLVLCIWLVAPATARQQAKEPAWGTVDARSLMISPPAEYVPRDDGPIQAERWHFPGFTPDRLSAFLGAAGFSADDAAYLLKAATPDTAMPGLDVVPGSDFIRRIAPNVRARLYAELAKSPANFDQASAYYFHGDSIDAWLGTDVVSPKTRALVDPLVYRIGDFLYLADIEVVREAMGGGADFQNLVRRLLRQPATFVSLSVDDVDDLDEVVEYWGRGGRQTDIRPLLESIADAGASQTINLSELLPELPRRLLYRYPKVTMADLAKPQLANCFWTALNFFNDEPDDRFLDVEVAMNAIRNDYFLVHDRLQLGDIAVFSSHEMNVFHVAVYLARGLVFTKNGAFSLAPWTILPIDELKGPYVGHAGDWVVTYYRRKGL
jgi:hypothetical protein